MTAKGPQTMKDRRKAVGVSQHDLAVAIDVTGGAISQYERGVNTPSRAVAERIDRHLDAGGAILDAFGYSATPPSGWVSLEQHVRLQDQVETLIARVQDLGAEVARLRKRVDRADG